MPVRKIVRVASGLVVTPVGGPNWNTVRVDPSTDTLVFGTGTSGTTEKTVSDLTSTQSITGVKTLTSPVLIGTPVINTVKGNFSTATVSAGYAADTYLAGSNIAIPTGGWVAGGRYICIFDMVKTAAGTAQFTINLRLGNAGSTADTSLIQWAFGAGTAAVDTGTFEIIAHFRTVGATTTAVVVGTAYCSHALAVTGLISTGASGAGQITSVSSGFDSTTANGVLGLSVNGGASFSGTNTLVEAEYKAY